MYATPIIKIENDNNELYVKRDDLLPFSFGGNKVRIALAFLHDMRNQGKIVLLDMGTQDLILAEHLQTFAISKVFHATLFHQLMKTEQESILLIAEWFSHSMRHFIIAQKQV